MTLFLLQHLSAPLSDTYEQNSDSLQRRLIPTLRYITMLVESHNVKTMVRYKSKESILYMQIVRTFVARLNIFIYANFVLVKNVIDELNFHDH